jgi:hypothetical protein
MLQVCHCVSVFKMFLSQIQTEFTKVTGIYDHFQDKVSLLYIYVIAFLVANFNLFGVTSHLFKYTELQNLNYLTRDLLSEIARGPHVDNFGDPCSRLQKFSKRRLRGVRVT